MLQSIGSCTAQSTPLVTVEVEVEVDVVVAVVLVHTSGHASLSALPTPGTLQSIGSCTAQSTPLVTVEVEVEVEVVVEVEEEVGTVVAHICGHAACTTGPKSSMVQYSLV